MMKAIRAAIPAALAGLAGATLAGAWFLNPIAGLAVAALLFVLAFAGWLAHRRGKKLLRGTPKQPKAAVAMLELRAIVPIVAGSFAAAILIAIAVLSAALTPTGTPEATKQVVTAAVAVFTTFITAVVLKSLDEFEGSISGPVEAEFQSAYKDCFANGSEEWRAIYDVNFQGEEGWASGSARRARAAFVDGKPCGGGA